MDVVWREGERERGRGREGEDEEEGRRAATRADDTMK